MSESEQLLSISAEIGAMRAVLTHTLALRLLEEPDPNTALCIVRAQLTGAATKPPSEPTGLDPAMSDLLAALTDERIEALLEELRARLERFFAVA